MLLLLFCIDSGGDDGLCLTAVDAADGEPHNWKISSMKKEEDWHKLSRITSDCVRLQVYMTFPGDDFLSEREEGEKIEEVQRKKNNNSISSIRNIK